jgi:hypothetical protein
MPTSAPPNAKEFAQLLLAHEVALGKPIGTKGVVAFRVVEKLRGPLGKAIGVGGFHSLMSRALTLAGPEVSWLMALQIKNDGSLEGLNEVRSKLDSQKLAEGEAVLVSELLGLLVTFIGATLTQQLLRDIWPTMDELHF